MRNQNGKSSPPKIPLMPSDKGELPEERTRELTGADASIDEATVGDAGNGADPFGADLVGGLRPLEDEPSGNDIQPDEVRRLGRPASRRGREAEEGDLTARPNEPMPPDPSEPD